MKTLQDHHCRKENPICEINNASALSQKIQHKRKTSPPTETGILKMKSTLMTQDPSHWNADPRKDNDCPATINKQMMKVSHDWA